KSIAFGQAVFSRTPCWSSSRGHTMAPEAQTPAQCPDRVQPHGDMAYNLLRTKHFHGVPPASPHAYSLQSRYGKVSLMSLALTTTHENDIYCCPATEQK